MTSFTRVLAIFSIFSIFTVGVLAQLPIVTEDLFINYGNSSFVEKNPKNQHAYVRCWPTSGFSDAATANPFPFYEDDTHKLVTVPEFDIPAGNTAGVLPYGDDMCLTNYRDYDVSFPTNSRSANGSGLDNSGGIRFPVVIKLSDDWPDRYTTTRSLLFGFTSAYSQEMPGGVLFPSDLGVYEICASEWTTLAASIAEDNAALVTDDTRAKDAWNLKYAEPDMTGGTPVISAIDTGMTAGALDAIVKKLNSAAAQTTTIPENISGNDIGPGFSSMHCTKGESYVVIYPKEPAKWDFSTIPVNEAQVNTPVALNDGLSLEPRLVDVPSIVMPSNFFMILIASAFPNGLADYIAWAGSMTAVDAISWVIIVVLVFYAVLYLCYPFAIIRNCVKFNASTVNAVGLPRWVIFLTFLLLPFLPIHRLMTRNWVSSVFYFCTLGFIGLWAIFDLWRLPNLIDDSNLRADAGRRASSARAARTTMLL